MEGAWLKGMVPLMSGVEQSLFLLCPVLELTEPLPPVLYSPDFFKERSLSDPSLLASSEEAGPSCPATPPSEASFALSSSGRDFERLRAAAAVWESEEEIGVSEELVPTIVPPPLLLPPPPRGERDESLLEKEVLPTTMPLSGD